MFPSLRMKLLLAFLFAYFLMGVGPVLGAVLIYSTVIYYATRFFRHATKTRYPDELDIDLRFDDSGDWRHLAEIQV